MIASCHVDGNRLYLVLQGQIDDDMPPTADDFTVASETQNYRVNALDVKVHDAQTVLLLLLDDAPDTAGALMLKYVPQQWMMCWADTGDSIEAFDHLLTFSPIESLDPALRLQANVSENEERRDISANNVAVLIRSAYEFLVQIEFNVHLQAAIPPNVNDFRAELEDRWLTVTQARYVRTPGSDYPSLLLELSERLSVGERLVIGYRSPSKRLRTIDDEAIPTFSCETVVEAKPLNEIIDEDDFDEEALEKIRLERRKARDAARIASDEIAEDVFSTELHDDAVTIARKAAEENAAAKQHEPEPEPEPEPKIVPEQEAEVNAESSATANEQPADAHASSHEEVEQQTESPGQEAASNIAQLTPHRDGKAPEDLTVDAPEEITEDATPETLTEHVDEEIVPQENTPENTASEESAPTETAQAPIKPKPDPVHIERARTNAADKNIDEDLIPRIVPPSEYSGDEVFTENLAVPYNDVTSSKTTAQTTQENTSSDAPVTSITQADIPADEISRAPKISKEKEGLDLAANATLESTNTTDKPKHAYNKLIYIVPAAVVLLIVIVAGVNLANVLFGTKIPVPAKVNSSASQSEQNQEVTYKREECILKSADGSVYEGMCAAGQRDGKGVYTWASGNRYEGEWLGGKRHGYGKLTYATGAVYEGEYRAGREHGEGKMRWPNGASYEGGYKDGRFHGQGTYRSASGNQYRGEFSDGSMTQNGTCTMQSGESYPGPCRSK